MADHWLPAWPGTEPVLLLAIARLLLEDGTWDREFVRRWVNWETFLARDPARPAPCTFDNVGPALLDLYAELHPRAGRASCAGIDAGADPRDRRLIGGRARPALARTPGGPPAAGNEGGWQTARCLWLLNVLTGSVGTEGGTSPNGWNKFIPVPPKPVHPHGRWNDLTWPVEYPLAHHELSMLLPALPQGGSGPHRHLLHPRLQPGLDQPRRVLAGSRC